VVPLHVNVIACDRFLYLPVACLAIASAVQLPRLVDARRLRPLAFAGCLLLLAFMGATYLRSLDWVDELRLWRDAVAHAPRWDDIPVTGLASQYLRMRRPEEARTYYLEAIATESNRRLYGVRSQPFSPGHFISLALCNEGIGQYQQAVNIYQDLTRRMPWRIVNWLGLARAQARALDFAAAEATLNAAPHVDELESLKAKERGLFARQASERAALPPFQSDEPVALLSLRAGLDNQLGRSWDASRLFAQVLQRPDATPEEALRAASYLLLKGPRADSEAALSRLARDAPPEKRAALQREFDFRWR
jgi:tetratricopeptide (TPR) repeat protein